jgi:hypothetical protein
MDGRTWSMGGRLLHVDAGSPHLFCYSDGHYLGSETSMPQAIKRCESNSKGDYVMEFETTEQVWKALKPKPKIETAWAETAKDNWQATYDGESLPARIRRLDDRTHAVYRDGKYLGSEATLATAKMRADIGTESQRNATMRLWEQTHPGELPPFLQLTAGERAEYWRRNPPVSAARATLARRPEEAGGSVATLERAMQEAAKRDGAAARVPVAKHRQPVAVAPAEAVASAERTAKGSDRDAVLAGMLKRGCTREEILRVTGWKAVSVQDLAKRLGLELRVEKGSKPFKYHAEEK